MCRTRGLTCTFEPRPERKQPIQRKHLLEEIRKKDIIIKSYHDMLKPHMLLQHGLTNSENNPSSDSPLSSAAHEEPLRRQVLEWLDKAEASRTTTVDFASTLGGMGMGGVGADGRGFNDSSSDEAGDDNEEGVDKLSTSTSALSRPTLPQRHSYPGGQTDPRRAAVSDNLGNGGGGPGPVEAMRTSRSRSPRVNRNSMRAVHPVQLIARTALRGSNNQIRMGGAGAGAAGSLNLDQTRQRQSTSSLGDSHSLGPPPSHTSYSHGFTSPVSQVDIGVARHDYFVSGDALEAQRARELGLRRIEIDRGLSEEPKLLRKGLIVPDEVDKLFEIFYEKLNVSLFLSLLLW